MTISVFDDQCSFLQIPKEIRNKEANFRLAFSASNCEPTSLTSDGSFIFWSDKKFEVWRQNRLDFKEPSVKLTEYDFVSRNLPLATFFLHDLEVISKIEENCYNDIPVTEDISTSDPIIESVTSYPIVKSTQNSIIKSSPEPIVRPTVDPIKTVNQDRKSFLIESKNNDDEKDLTSDIDSIVNTENTKLIYQTTYSPETVSINPKFQSKNLTKPSNNSPFTVSRVM